MYSRAAKTRRWCIYWPNCILHGICIRHRPILDIKCTKTSNVFGHFYTRRSTTMFHFRLFQLRLKRLFSAKPKCYMTGIALVATRALVKSTPSLCRDVHCSRDVKRFHGLHGCIASESISYSTPRCK